MSDPRLSPSQPTSSPDGHPRRVGPELTLLGRPTDDARPLFPRPVFFFESQSKPNLVGTIAVPEKSKRRITRDIKYDSPGTRQLTMNGTLSHATSRKRMNYYEDSFAYKDGHGNSAKERVAKDAPIIAELRTNVIVSDEFTLVSELSHHLSVRYARPEACIMINVTHSSCVLYGGTFDPAYLLTLSMLPSFCAPTLNKRNTALTQNFLSDILSVTPDRGIIRFNPIQEDNFGTNLMTIGGEIERLERVMSNSGTSGNKANVKKASSKRSIKSLGRAKSSPNLEKKKSGYVGQVKPMSPPLPSSKPVVPATAKESYDSILDGTTINDNEKTTTFLATEDAAVDSKPSTRTGLNMIPKSTAAGGGIPKGFPAPPPIPVETEKLTPSRMRKRSFLGIKFGKATAA